MRAMILAAGRGERARPLTDVVPKPLLPLAGHPTIAYPLGLLKSAGVSRVVVNTAYKGEMIHAALAGCEALGTDVAFSDEAEGLETGGGIANARALLGDETFIVLNSDVVCDVDLAWLTREHESAGAAATMLLRTPPEGGRYAAVEWDHSTGDVLDLRGKTGVTTPDSAGMMFTGVHVLEPVVFDYLRPVKESIVDAFYLPALRDGLRVHGVPFDGYWEDIGDVGGYLRVRETFDPGTLTFARPLPIDGAEHERLIAHLIGHS